MGNYYPPVGFYFEVKIAGNSTENDASFAEVSGLDAERDVVEVKEGGENRFSHRLPDRAKSGNLVLKRGILVSASPLFDWCKEVFESDLEKVNPVTPKNINVSLLDPDGSPLITWNVTHAWPVKWSLAAFNATANEVAMETLEFAYAYAVRELNRDMGATGFFSS